MNELLPSIPKRIWQTCSALMEYAVCYVHLASTYMYPFVLFVDQGRVSVSDMIGFSNSEMASSKSDGECTSVKNFLCSLSGELNYLAKRKTFFKFTLRYCRVSEMLGEFN